MLKTFLSAIYTHLYINGLDINLYINLYLKYINSSVYILIYIYMFFCCTMMIYIPFILFKSNRDWFKKYKQEFLLFRKSLTKQTVYSVFINSTAIFKFGFTNDYYISQCKHNLIKKRLQQMFSCEYWEISKNTYFEERLCTVEVTVLDFISGQSLSKPSWLSNITKLPVAFKPEL